MNRRAILKRIKESEDIKFAKMSKFYQKDKNISRYLVSSYNEIKSWEIFCSFPNFLYICSVE